ncbi:MAG: FIST C-terminal domain-containing protein [Gammaproteobacteria bacterium]|nr:FIST C-terminal domain-containing protein [Gammaproteobacteria bacterium]
MKAGIGYSNISLSKEAGRQALNSALTDAALSGTQLSADDMVLAFCGAAVNASEFYHGIRSGLPAEVPIFGGSAIGVITNQALSYSGHPAVVAVLKLSSIKAKVALVEELYKDPLLCGEQLAQQLDEPADASLQLLLYDSVKYPATATQPPVLNPSAPLLKGLETWSSGRIPTVGAGLLGDHQFSATWQFAGHQVLQQSAMLLQFRGALQPYLTSMHGCVPYDKTQYKITNIFGQFLYSLNGEPVVPLIDRVYGSTQWRQASPVKQLSLGVYCGDPQQPQREDLFVNRLISGALPDGSGVILFEPDLAAGMQVQLMRRDPDTILASARVNSKKLLNKIKADGRKARFALYFDCGGRAAAYDNNQHEEAAEIQAQCNAFGVPLLGIYCGVEIAPFLGKSRGLDWSGVFVVFAE